jgi:hypothetical protein
MMPTFSLHIDGQSMDDFEAEDEQAARMYVMPIAAAELTSGRSTAIQVFCDDPNGTTQRKRVVLLRTDIPMATKPEMSESLLTYLRDVHSRWESSREYDSHDEPDLIYAIDSLAGQSDTDYADCKEELDDLAKTVGGLTEIGDLID